MLQLSGEADLSSLTTDNLLVYQVFSGINEDNLFAKLMELEDPTFFFHSRFVLTRERLGPLLRQMLHADSTWWSINLAVKILRVPVEKWIALDP